MKSIPLHEIATIQQGYTFKPEYQGTGSGKWMYVKVRDINTLGNTKYITNTENYVDDDVLEKMKAKPFSAGSIVFPRVGEALKLNNKRILAKSCLTDDNVLIISVTNEAVCYPEFLYYWFESIDLQRFCNDGSVPVIGGKNLKNQTVSLPSLPDQIAIASLLSTWHLTIEKIERLTSVKEKLYSRALTEFFTRTARARVHVNTFAVEVTKRNSAAACQRVLSVTNRNGFVLPEEQFNRRVASADLSNYKAVHRGQYAYNPSRINVGSIARLDSWDIGVLSPMYVVFKLNEKKVNSDYFLHWLESHEAKERIRKSAQGSVRETVSFSEFSSIQLPLPTLKLQDGIANYLNAQCKEINLLNDYVEKLKLQKRGLMQKLLTGQWRVKTEEPGVTE